MSSRWRTVCISVWCTLAQGTQAWPDTVMAAVVLARAHVTAVRLDQLAHQRDAELHAVLAGAGPDGRQLLAVRQHDLLHEGWVLPRQRVLGLTLVVRQDLALVAADLARLLVTHREGGGQRELGAVFGHLLAGGDSAQHL